MAPHCGLQQVQSHVSSQASAQAPSLEATGDFLHPCVSQFGASNVMTEITTTHNSPFEVTMTSLQCKILNGGEERHWAEGRSNVSGGPP